MRALHSSASSIVGNCPDIILDIRTVQDNPRLFAFAKNRNKSIFGNGIIANRRTYDRIKLRGFETVIGMIHQIAIEGTITDTPIGRKQDTFITKRHDIVNGERIGKRPPLIGGTNIYCQKQQA